jgi:hypothetical protein
LPASVFGPVLFKRQTIYATNGSGDVKRLKGTHGCLLRRVIFIEDTRSITVIAVGNRREIYG